MDALDQVTRFNSLLASDRAAAFALLAPDFVLTQAPSLPYGGVWPKDQLGAFFQRFTDYWQQFQTLHTEYYPAGDLVVAHSVIRGVVRHTGQTIEMPMVQLYRVGPTGITSAQPFYWDTGAFTAT